MFQNNSFKLGPQTGGMGGGGGMDSAMRPQIGVGGGSVMPQQSAQPYQPQMYTNEVGKQYPQQPQPQPYASGGGFGQPQQNQQQNLLAMLQRMQGGMGGSMPQPQSGVMGGSGGYNPNQQFGAGGTGGFNPNGQFGAQPQQSNLLQMLFGGR
jgi:hypothetical protein